MSNSTAIISFADEGYAAFREVAWPRQHAYAMLHGYDWRGYTIRKTDRPPSWNKILLLQDSLHKYQTVWWLDADAAPVRPDVPLPTFEADIAIAKDHNGYNCGVFGLNASQAVTDFLREVWQQDDCINHPWWEQSAIQRLLANGRLSVTELPKRYNAYPQDADRVILHCPAMPIGRRLDHLRGLPPAPTLPQLRWRCHATGSRAVIAMDPAHIALIHGLILAAKPRRILELGLGTGSSTRAILEAIAFNACGRLTVVDNWLDWRGIRPPLADVMAKAGVQIIEADQGAFLAQCESDAYDFLVSDADHFSSDLENQLRVVSAGGIAVFHDTNAAVAFPALEKVRANAEHYPHYHFVRNSRPDERCDRGLLMVIKS